MNYSLRPYQAKIVETALADLEEHEHVLHSLSCAAGKSWVAAELAKRWHNQGAGKVLILTISKELCQQDYDKLSLVMEGENVGMYSASWGRKETEILTVATVQSAYKHPELWEEYTLVILDECEAIPIDGMAGKLCENKKVYGISATCYSTIGSRKGNWYTTKLWPLHKIKTKYGWFWRPISYSLSEKQLLEMGYLCPLRIFASPINCHLLKLHSNGSEYTSESLQKWVDATLRRVISVMQGAEQNELCHSGIVFMPSVESCDWLAEECAKRSISAKAVHSKTPSKERLQIVEDHKSGTLTWLINMGVATRGFDNPKVDCLILARPTGSLKLLRQCLGRGIRMAEGKTICNVLDLTENTKRWGGIEDVEMGKALHNGYECDTILLKGKDISGMEMSKINLLEKKNVNVARTRQSREKGTQSS